MSFRLTNFEHVVPFGVTAWVTFDIEFNSGEVARDVSLVQTGDAFKLLSSSPELNASAELRERVLQAAAAEMNWRPAPRV